MDFLKVNKNLNGSARELRKNMTSEEKRLWHDFLKSYNVQFNRQKVIGNYIVDFFCKSAMLVIEIDGAQHYLKDELEYDKERTAYFNSLGIEVVRFLNKDIKYDFENSCKYIDTIVKRRVGR